MLLTKGAPHNEQRISFLPNSEVQIDGNRIVYAGPADGAPEFKADREIDGSGMLCMPGLCNMHTHTPMTLLRSVGGDQELHDWLFKSIFPLEKQLDDEAVEAGMALGLMEMLRFGTTSFCDMYMHSDAMASVTERSGMRALLGYGVVDFDESCADLDEGLAMVDRWHHSASDRIRITLAPHSEGATTPKLMRKVARIAKEQKLTIHVHVSETKMDYDECLQRRGCTPPAYLEQMGILDSPVVAAHCVWMTDEDIRLFAERGVTIAHNPVSNLKLASGIAPIGKMLDAGCRVALGTDGVASNNNLNLWEELKLMPLLQKGVMLKPSVVSSMQALRSATLTGAEAMGYDRLGLLEAGYLADLILVDVQAPHMLPARHMEDNLVYATQGSDVRLTMVDGQILYQDGQYLTLDEEDVMRRACAAADRLAEKAEKAKAEQA